MNTKERVMAVLHHEEPDMTPFLVYAGNLPRGSTERELRRMGLGLKMEAPVLELETENIRVEQNVCMSLMPGISRKILHTTYHTPMGNVSTKHRTDLMAESRWTKDYPIKNLHDCEVVRFIVENTFYHSHYKTFLDVERDLGCDGVVMTSAGKSPLQKIIYELMGYQTFSIYLYRHLKEFEDLMRTIENKEDEMYRIIAESPAEIVWCPDNITGPVTSPELFVKYCIPFYNKQARLLHEKGKIYEVHMDGIGTSAGFNTENRDRCNRRLHSAAHGWVPT